MASGSDSEEGRECRALEHMTETRLPAAGSGKGFANKARDKRCFRQGVGRDGVPCFDAVNKFLVETNKEAKGEGAADEATEGVVGVEKQPCGLIGELAKSPNEAAKEAAAEASAAVEALSAALGMGRDSGLLLPLKGVGKTMEALNKETGQKRRRPVSANGVRQLLRRASSNASIFDVDNGGGCDPEVRQVETEALPECRSGSDPMERPLGRESSCFDQASGNAAGVGDSIVVQRRRIRTRPLRSPSERLLASMVHKDGASGNGNAGAGDLSGACEEALAPQGGALRSLVSARGREERGERKGSAKAGWRSPPGLVSVPESPRSPLGAGSDGEGPRALRAAAVAVARELVRKRSGTEGDDRGAICTPLPKRKALCAGSPSTTGTQASLELVPVQGGLLVGCALLMEQDMRNRLLIAQSDSAAPTPRLATKDVLERAADLCQERELVLKRIQLEQERLVTTFMERFGHASFGDAQPMTKNTPKLGRGMIGKGSKSGPRRLAPAQGMLKPGKDGQRSFSGCFGRGRATREYLRELFSQSKRELLVRHGSEGQALDNYHRWLAEGPYPLSLAAQLARQEVPIDAQFVAHIPDELLPQETAKID
eukprot:TRINITY_DN4559_c0_g1_i1.p1 TRINITY_DN4559_c0_g1~~TRINITY_DN4559_c0_g1_i1.p1  ORF type:complete len:682 (+),score=145.04 TRINITY_DN4559_c0_g1_i1:249-2048(+)